MKNIHHHKNRQVLNRKRVNPTDFTYTGNNAESTKVDFYQYSKKDFFSSENTSLKDLQFSDTDFNVKWIAVYGLKEVDDIIQFCQKNNIHRLSIQDILDLNQRTKFQKFDNYSFLVLKTMNAKENQLKTEQISIIIKDNYLISFQEKNTPIFEHIKQRLTKNKGIIREKNVGYLLFTIIESLLDDYFKVLNQIETKTNLINFHLDEDPSAEDLSLLENYKKRVYFIKKSILPLKEFTLKFERKELSFIDEELYKYFFEIKDLYLTIIDECDAIINSIESDINLFFSIQGQRMNNIMKTLTVMATIFIPLTFIAGVYGMNFSNMPELDSPYGYIATWILFVVIAVALLIYFKKKKWF